MASVFPRGLVVITALVLVLYTSGVYSNDPSTHQCAALPGSTESLFTSFIEPLSPVDFFTRYFEQEPVVIEKDGETQFSELISLEKFRSLIQSGLKYDTQVLAVKNGRFLKHKQDKVFAMENYQKQVGGGATVLIPRVHQLLPAVHRFCRLLEHFFYIMTSATAAHTPPRAPTAPVWDVHDSFLVQAEGTLRVTVYKPPQSLVLPRDHNMWKGKLPVALNELDQVLDVELEEGSMLYLPRGYIYVKEALNEDAVSLVIGLEQSGLAWDNLFAFGISTAMQGENGEYFMQTIGPKDLKVNFWERHRGAEPEEMQLSVGLVIHASILCVSDQDKSGAFRKAVLPSIKADLGANIPGVYNILVGKLRLGCPVEDLIPYIDQDEDPRIEKHLTDDLVSEIMQRYCDTITDRAPALLNVMMSIFSMMTGPNLGTITEAIENPEKLPPFKKTYKYTGYSRYRKIANRMLVAAADAQGPVVLANGHKIRVKQELFPLVPIIDSCVDFKVADLPTDVPISKKMWFVRKLIQADVLEVIDEANAA